MEQTVIGYKLIKKVKDSRFNVDDLQNYHLSLQIGVRDFQLCIIDTRNQQCLLLEDYILSSVKSHSALIEVLGKLFEAHHLLMAGFWKSVRFSFKSSKFSHVPAPLFAKDALYEYIKLNCEVNLDTEDVLYYENKQFNAVTVFAVNKNLLRWIRSIYPSIDVEMTHQSAALIEGALFQKEQSESAIYLYVDRFRLHIITLRQGRFEYYNQFAIKQFSDYLKYTMLVMKGLDYEQADTKVILWGYIGKKSPHYNEFSKFIKNISFGKRPSFLKFGFTFDEVQDHHFYDLYNTYLCE